FLLFGAKTFTTRTEKRSTNDQTYQSAALSVFGFRRSLVIGHSSLFVPAIFWQRNARCVSFSILFCMNPNENDLTRDEPLPAQQFQSREEDMDSPGLEQFRRAKKEVSTQMSHKWDQTKEKASRALDRTEHFVRENPVPTILGALGLGI